MNAAGYAAPVDLESLTYGWAPFLFIIIIITPSLLAKNAIV